MAARRAVVAVVPGSRWATGIAAVAKAGVAWVDVEPLPTVVMAAKRDGVTAIAAWAVKVVVAVAAARAAIRVILVLPSITAA